VIKRHLREWRSFVQLPGELIVRAYTSSPDMLRAEVVALTTSFYDHAYDYEGDGDDHDDAGHDLQLPAVVHFR
jgi:hypothetical protein